MKVELSEAAIFALGNAAHKRIEWLQDRQLEVMHSDTSNHKLWMLTSKAEIDDLKEAIKALLTRP